MACTRGCEGVSICNALGLCCIQFLQECGKECDGVAEGYSTIQFDDAGNLVVCSNVGGVCECSQCCVTEIAFDNTCDDGGVGTDYALWEADLTDGVLTLNGAPEHTAARANAADNLPIPGNPHPANPGPDPVTNLDQAEVEVDFINPSDCRTMQIMVVASGNMNIQDYVPPLRFSATIQIWQDGVFRASNNVYFADSLDAPVFTSVSVTVSAATGIVAGGTSTFRVVIVSGNWSNVPVNQIGSFVRVSMIGVTV